MCAPIADAGRGQLPERPPIEQGQRRDARVASAPPGVRAADVPGHDEERDREAGGDEAADSGASEFANAVVERDGDRVESAVTGGRVGGQHVVERHDPHAAAREPATLVANTAGGTEIGEPLSSIE